MFESLTHRAQQALTRRRIVAASAIGCAIFAGSIALPPLVDALRYEHLVTEHQDTRNGLVTVQENVAQAQLNFEDAAADALKEHAYIAEFLGTVDTKLLYDKRALHALISHLGDLEEHSGIHAMLGRPSTMVTWGAAVTPRIPEPTSPSTVDGLRYALERNHGIIAGYTEAAELMTDRAVRLRDDLTRARALMDEVLASAAKHGSSPAALRYDKADVLVKVAFNVATGNLTDTTLDPMARLTGYQQAVAAVKKSHSDTIAEEERLAKEKREAEERAAAEEARIAAEEAAQAEEERLREEAERAQPQPAPEPSPTPQPSPTLTPTPTPTPAPEG